MFLNTIKETIGPAIASNVMKVKRVSPELYLAGAVVLGVASVVAIAKAHKKSDEVIEEYKEEVDTVNWELDDLEEFGRDGAGDKVVVTRQDRTRALAPVHAKLGVTLLRMYGPGIIFGVGAVGCVLASHGVMKGRSNALLSTVALLEGGWRNYRKRVVEELGPEADERFYYGADQRTVVTVEKGEDGKKSKKRKQNQNYIPETLDPSIYTRVFDQYNKKKWSDDDGTNEFILHAAQRQLNDEFQIKGYLFLNDVYKALGFAETGYGQIVGWSKKKPGDGYIDLGLERDINQREGESRWIIDPNVQGVVWDLVGPEPEESPIYSIA